MRLPAVIYWCLGVLCTFRGVLTAADFHIYAPSPTTGTLMVVQASEQNNELSLRIVEQPALGHACRAIVAHPQQPWLYVAVGPKTEKDVPKGALVRLTAGGLFADVKHQPFVNGSAYLSLDRRNKFLLSANYFDGEVSVYALEDNGELSKQVAFEKMAHPYAHAVLTSPDNANVYIPFVKTHNALLQYRFDENTGTLTAMTPHNVMPPDGTGPRHIAYHPTLPFVYFSNEQQLGVSVYRRSENGALSFVAICHALAADVPKDGVSASDIVITPDGNFIYTGMRGTKQQLDNVVRYKIENDGTVTLLGLTPADQIPWGFTLSPDGRYLIVTASQGGTITAYRIGTDGSLTKAAVLACDKGIVDVVCRPIP